MPTESKTLNYEIKLRQKNIQEILHVTEISWSTNVLINLATKIFLRLTKIAIPVRWT